MTIRVAPQESEPAVDQPEPAPARAALQPGE